MKRRKRKTRNRRHRTAVVAGVVLVVAIALIIAACLFLFHRIARFDDVDTSYVYIDSDDDIDSVYVKLAPMTTTGGRIGFRILASYTGYAGNIRSGRYAVGRNDGVITVFRRMKNGMQEPVRLTIPSVRTMDRLAAYLSDKLMIDSAAVSDALTDTAVCSAYGYTPQTIVCIFIPNTYDVYWNVTVDKLLERMKKESDTFWNAERQSEADSIGMTRVEVMTLASIIDEETADDAEKPMIAGMYINRLKAGMPLQADPTVKFAIGDFSIRRIYHNMLTVDSPYNTYMNTGLPPGPIRIPSIAGIDAVLRYVHHDYLYMCAKEDFSGTHNFAATYKEHLANAAKYSKALNERGIK